jgi:hypothetical protein
MGRAIPARRCRLKTDCYSVVVFIKAHRLAGTIDQEVVNQMAAAQEGDFVAVQQPVQPVAKKTRPTGRRSKV